MERDDVLDGRYRLVRKLGAGGFGVVWEAFDERIRRRIAVKVLAAPPGHETTSAARFAQEATTAGNLSNPHIVTVHDYGDAEVDGRRHVFLVMELLTGRSLADALESGPPPLHQALEWAAQICVALRAAHDAGVVHRDIKPENIMVCEPLDTIKVLDFGIAKSVDEAVTSLTTTGTFVGSVAYTAPERFLGQPVDARSDLYSLGCVLTELFTGRTPFGTATTPQQVMFWHVHEQPPAPSALRPGVPLDLDRLVLDLLAKEPGQRPADAAKVRARLLAVAGTSSLPGQPTSHADTVLAEGAPADAVPPGPASPSGPSAPSAPSARLREALALPDPASAANELRQIVADLTAELGPADRQTLAARVHLADRTGVAGDPGDAVRQLRAVVTEAAAALGPDDRQTLEDRRLLADWTGQAGDEVEAARQLGMLVVDSARVLGPDDRESLLARIGLAYWSPPMYALRAYYDLIPHLAHVLGGTARETLDARHNAAVCHWQVGERGEALRQMRTLTSDSAIAFGPDDPAVLERREMLADWTGYSGDTPGAVVAYHALVADLTRLFGPEAPVTLEARLDRAFWTGEAGQPVVAVTQYQELLPALDRVLGADSELAQQARLGLADCERRSRKRWGLW